MLYEYSIYIHTCMHVWNIWPQCILYKKHLRCWLQIPFPSIYPRTTVSEARWLEYTFFKKNCCCIWVISVVSDSVRPHRQQPNRLPCPRDSPGKNTGVGCHFLLQCTKVKSESEVAQSCPTLSDPMDCSLPGSSVHGIFQARVLEGGAIAFSELKKKN